MSRNLKYRYISLGISAVALILSAIAVVIAYVK